jgi:hypothetical protein
MRKWLPVIGLFGLLVVASLGLRFEPPTVEELPTRDELQWRLEGRTYEEVLDVMGEPLNDSGPGPVRFLTYPGVCRDEEGVIGDRATIRLVEGRVENVLP